MDNANKKNECIELFNFFIEQNKKDNIVCFNNKNCYYSGIKCDYNENIDKSFIDDLVKTNKLKIIGKYYDNIYYQNGDKNKP
jgi:hypothetical protein